MTMTNPLEQTISDERDCRLCGGAYDGFLGFTLHDNFCAAHSAVESGVALTTDPLTALRAFMTAYKASNEPRSGAMYDAYLSGTIAVRAQP